MLNFLPLVLAFPALGVLVNGFLGRYIGRKAHWPAIISTGLSLGLSLFFLYQAVFRGLSGEVHLFEWIAAPSFLAEVAFLLDPSAP